MKITEPIKRVLQPTRKELYSCGWNGDKSTITNHIKELLEETSYENFSYSVLECNLYGDIAKITLELLMNEETIYIDTSSVHQIPCPNCYGEGEIEYVGSHSFYQSCDKCNGTGKVDYESQIK